MATRDVLAAIDAALGCHQCGGPLGGSPSDDFCCAEHQRAWHARRAVALPWEADAALVYPGYDGAHWSAGAGAGAGDPGGGVDDWDVCGTGALVDGWAAWDDWAARGGPDGLDHGDICGTGELDTLDWALVRYLELIEEYRTGLLLGHTPIPTHPVVGLEVFRV
jgi:hypothetical protein